MLYCRTLYLSVDPFLRCRFNEDTGVEYTKPYAVGAPIASAGIGQVLACGAAAASKGFAAGDLVLQAFDAWPWASEASVAADTVSRIPPALGLLLPPTALLGAAGQPGLTAWVGVTRVAKPQAGETVVVSGAAGAVGSIVCQMCRRRGARVVGLAGSPAKLAWLLESGLVDRAIDYKSEELPRLLGEEEADVYWDNAGGRTSDAVITNALRPGARIVVCGQISMYDTDEEYPPPLKPDVQAVATRLGIQRERYLVLDHAEAFPRALAELCRMVASGELSARETLWAGGVADAPGAFVEMMGGANFGKAIVAAPAEPGRYPLSLSWRAAEAARGMLPSAVRGALAARFVTEDVMAAAVGGGG